MKRFFRSIILLFFIFAAAIILWWTNGISAASSSDTKRQPFTIVQGEGTRQVGYALKDAGLIRDPWVFFFLVKLAGFEGRIQAGDFQLAPNQTPQTILSELTKGTQDIWITIPEGLRAAEIATILKTKLPSYDSSWAAKLQTQEGYLFPDTYSFPKDITVDQIITTMEDNFQKKYAEAKAHQTNSLSKNDVVILASIVQREAITPHDMRYVASTLENRLNIGMALGSDVTTEYALGYQTDTKTWWKQNLTVDDLAIDNPYNTRKYAGLPPTPISNPGLVAMEAVVNPPPSDYLYYISDSKGVLHFAKTLAGHNANIQKYGE